MSNIKIFENELTQIKNEDIRNFTIKVLEKLPEYFWEVPASSTGKYHPGYTQGNGGLARHVKAAVKIAIELFNLDMWKFSEEHKDIILSALFLHDGLKSGLVKSQYTVHDHPVQMAKFIQNDQELSNMLPIPIMAKILCAIKSHMGQWNTNSKSSIILPKPETGIEKFVHMCDYLASRKCIEMNFNV